MKQLRAVQVGFQEDDDRVPKTDAEKLQKRNNEIAQMRKHLQHRWVAADNIKSQPVEPYLEAIGSPFTKLHRSPLARERAFRANQMRSRGRLLRKSVASACRHKQNRGSDGAAFNDLLTASRMSVYGGGDDYRDLKTIGGGRSNASVRDISLIRGSEMVTGSKNDMKLEASFSERRGLTTLDGSMERSTISEFDFDPPAVTKFGEAVQQMSDDETMYGMAPSTLIMAVAPALQSAGCRPAETSAEGHRHGYRNNNRDLGACAQPSSPATVQLVMATPQSLARDSKSFSDQERPHTSHGCGNRGGYDISTINPYAGAFYSPRVVGSANLMGKYPQRVPVSFGLDHLSKQNNASSGTEATRALTGYNIAEYSTTPTQAMRARQQRTAKQQISWARHSAARNHQRQVKAQARSRVARAAARKAGEEARARKQQRGTAVGGGFGTLSAGHAQRAESCGSASVAMSPGDMFDMESLCGSQVGIPAWLQLSDSAANELERERSSRQGGGADPQGVISVGGWRPRDLDQPMLCARRPRFGTGVRRRFAAKKGHSEHFGAPRAPALSG